MKFLFGIVILLVILAFTTSYLTNLTQSCKGSKKCFTGTMERIIDGDTFVVDNKEIRLALVNTPEVNQSDYIEAKDFIEKICPIGSKVRIDQDDLQLYSYGRIVAVAYCNGKNINAELLYNNLGKIYTDFCSKSEFGNENWAKDYGC